MQADPPFDILARTYDADFTLSAIGQLQRKRVWTFLAPLLSSMGQGLKILEINCGTGEDAMLLSAMGHQVIATDASPVMIEMAKEKQVGLAEVEFRVCAFDQLAHQFSAQEFDLVFSNFGGLNCIEEQAIVQLSKGLSSLVRPGGKLFLVLMSRCCIWEIMHYGVRGKFKKAFRRSKGIAAFSVNGSTMPVYYFSPGQLKKMFSPLFSLQEKHPVGLFIPPSYLEERFKGKQHRLERLDKLENRFGNSCLSSFADHYCTIFKKQITNS